MNTSSGENAYTIIETIHKSGRFCVYKAKNYFHGNIVTIKTTEQRWRADAQINSMLRDEAETGIKLQHPNIRKTTGLFEDEGTIYIVSEYVDGDVLNSLLSVPSVDFSYEKAYRWTLQLLDAMEYAHSQKVIHTNLNPDNILITLTSDLLLFGFGKSAGAWKSADTDKNMYHPILFTAPEIFEEKSPDERSDIYSLGVLFYVLFCGQLPWAVDKREIPSHQKAQTFQRPVQDPELSGKRLPNWLFRIINKCLMLEPSYRFASVADVRSALLDMQEIPYQSCLTRKIAIVPAHIPVAEDFTTTEPEVITEVPSRTPVTREFEPKQDTLYTPKPATQQQTPPPPVRQNQPVPEDTEEKQEISKMRKMFRVLRIAMLIILVYIVVKYVIISEKPKFSKDPAVAEEMADEEFKVTNEELAMVQIAGGKAVIGDMGETAETDESPVKTLQLQPFKLSVHEITREQWAMVTPGFVVDDYEKLHPVVNVSFFDALDYCNAKSIADGLKPCYQYTDDSVICDFSQNGYRLPTEAEWEFAAKSMRASGYPEYSGSGFPEEVGWFEDNADDRVRSVKEKKPNSLGLYDMSGNAREWCWDWYAQYSSVVEDMYSGPSTGSDRVIRGGSWKLDAQAMRVSNRDYAKPYTKNSDLGFRVAQTSK